MAKWSVGVVITTTSCAITWRVLCRYCSGCPSPPSLRFERNPHGKPRLSFEEAEEQPYPPLHFSLTHTSTMLGEAAKSLELPNILTALCFIAEHLYTFACTHHVRIAYHCLARG